MGNRTLGLISLFECSRGELSSCVQDIWTGNYGLETLTVTLVVFQTR